MELAKKIISYVKVYNRARFIIQKSELSRIIRVLIINKRKVKLPLLGSSEADIGDPEEVIIE